MLHLLKGISNANSVLLREGQLDRSLQRVVEELGEATRVDRCYIFTNRVADDNSLRLYYTHEWNNTGIIPQLGNPDLSDMSYDLFPGLYGALSQDQAFYGLVRESKNPLFREIMTSQDIKAFLFTPIFCDTEFWGWLGYDDCATERQWLQEEAEALHAVARNIGIRLLREQSEKRFNQAQERFELALKASQQGMWEWDLLNDSLHYSETMMGTLGYSHYEFEHTYQNWSSRVHPDDLPRLRETLDNYLAGKTGSYSTEFRMRHKTGREVWIRGSGVARWNEDGLPVFIAGSHLDITDLKIQQSAIEQQRNEYDDLINNLAEVVFRLNGNYEFSFLNKFWHTISGYSEAQCLNRSVSDFLFPEDRPKMRTQFDLLRKKPQETAEFEARLVDSEGNLRWVQIIARKFSTDSPDIAGSIIDIQLRKEAEQRQSELSELKSNFIAMASHQFRTPLTVIYSNMELAENYATKVEPSLADKFGGLAQRVKNEVERMTSLIDNILIFGKYNTLETPIHFKPVLIYSLIEQVISTYFPKQSDGRSVILKVEPGEKDRRVDLDELLFTYSLTNILSNAFKYSEGAPDPEVHLSCADSMVRIEVQDWGIGIPAEELDKLFNSFYRASNTSTIQGSGLGLVVARQFIELHRGTIQIQSKLGYGTTVVLTLPQTHDRTVTG